MKTYMSLLALGVAVVLSACGQGGSGGSSARPVGDASSAASAPGAPQVITAKEAYERINSGDALVILDVRTAEEYAEAHIAGAVLLPNEDIGDARPAELPVLDTEILIYCRSGNRSAQAAAKLSALGYTNLFDFGGIRDWPYETERGAWAPEEKSGTLDSFVSYDLNGVRREESIFADHRLTMVNVWATYCGPCLREMPALGQLAADYAQRGVRVVGLVANVPQAGDGTFPQERVELARALAAKTGAEYLHLLPTADMVTAKLRSVQAVPTTFFVDETGEQVGDVSVGAKSGADWAALIDSLLEEEGE